MTKLSPRVTARKPYVPPKLTYFGQMNEIVMQTGETGSTPGGGRGGSVWKGFKDRY